MGAEPDSIAAFLDELRAVGVDNVLALRGDPPAGKTWDWNKAHFRHEEMTQGRLAQGIGEHRRRNDIDH